MCQLVLELSRFMHFHKATVVTVVMIRINTRTSSFVTFRRHDTISN